MLATSLSDIGLDRLMSCYSSLSPFLTLLGLIIWRPSSWLSLLVGGGRLGGHVKLVSRWVLLHGMVSYLHP